MNPSEQIICKPTPWFTLRAVAMLAMFSVFAVLFFIDGTTGYRKKNLEFYVHATFQKASATFAKMNEDKTLTAESWKDFASEQNVDFPEDSSVLPKDLELPMKWPAVLQDYGKMKELQPHLLWQKYSGENRMSNSPPEHDFDSGKIREQIVVFYICLGLALLTLYFLIRTTLRSLRADDEALTTASGARIPYQDMKSLDLRKWDTKGIAVVEYDGNSGKGRARIDGLTYGGFKKDQGEPAEKLMQKIRSNFSGEIIEYTSIDEPESPSERPENN
ncbi:hypothetical protein ACFSSA_08960 [Luteolibacter algae]|uniref:DUF3592 domain-containing protein n=1 Tax=Luteolibacter algae TaxID=454151 RepID=A0ABW5D8R1_9BACT